MQDESCRPSPITIPGIEDSVLKAVPPQAKSAPNRVSGNVNLGPLSSKQSVFTPGQLTSIIPGQHRAYKPDLPIAIGHGTSTPISVCDQSKQRFAFFVDFPLEIRQKIYRYLIGDLYVDVNAGDGVGEKINISQRKAAHPYSITPLPHVADTQRHQNWLCISRQFFFETRGLLWRCMAVRFSRRWDFITGRIRGTLDITRPQIAPSGHDAICIFPAKTDVYFHIRRLTLNLCSADDFCNRVCTAEVVRVTSAMLQIITDNMPRLTHLDFEVDDKSRLSASLMVFLPDPWFLEALLAIKHVRTIELRSGPGFRGHAQCKKNARLCIEAVTAVLRAHFGTRRRPSMRLDRDGVTGKELQSRLGRAMLRYFHGDNRFADVLVALQMKLVMLETVIR